MEHTHPSGVLTQQPETASHPHGTRTKGKLSDIQQKIARLIALQMSNKQIADATGKTENNIKQHIKIMLMHNNYPNRVGLAVLAISLGLTTIEEVLKCRKEF